MRNMKSGIVMPNLVVGTAQLVAQYGILDRRSPAEITFESGTKTLELAASLGLVTVDTAPNYGRAEEVIGALNFEFTIDTKVPSFSLGPSSLRASLARLATKKVRTVFLHSRYEDTLAERAGIVELEAMRGREYERLGASVYERKDIDSVTTAAGIDAIQVPYSVLDRRFDSAELEKNFDPTTVWHARGIYSQGLLTSGQSNMDAIPRKLLPFLQAFWKTCDDFEVGYNHAALGWALSHGKISEIIVGTSCERELAELVRLRAIQIPDKLLEKIRELEPPSWDVVDPRNW